MMINNAICQNRAGQVTFYVWYEKRDAPPPKNLTNREEKLAGPHIIKASYLRQALNEENSRSGAVQILRSLMEEA